MVESTIDKIKDITVERQIRKLAGIIDEQNDTISQYGDASSEIETLKTNDAKQTTDINNLNNTVAPIPAQIQSLIDTDANQATQINNLKQSIASDKLATEAAITELQSKDASQDGTLANHATLIQGITESLVSDVQILDGITTGDIKVRIDREDAASIDSNSYNLGLPVSAEIIQGTGPSMFKIQITMSSGVKVVSNDFVFTTEAIGTDVYISSFTFKAGNQDGYLCADIGLNNGVIIEANNFLVPTDPNVISNITDLQNRMVEVEKVKTDIDSINSEISGIMSDLNTKVNISQGIDNAGKALVIGEDGNVTTGEVSTGGEAWEEIDTSNIPTDFVEGDKIKIIFNTTVDYNASSWSSKPTSVTASLVSTGYLSEIMEFELTRTSKAMRLPICIVPTVYAYGVLYLSSMSTVANFNSGSMFTVSAAAFNAGGLTKVEGITITRESNTTAIYRMWRLKK